MGAPAVTSHLGVTLRTVYAIIDEGQLPAFKIRRVIRVRREDVDEYLEHCRRRLPVDIHVWTGWCQRGASSLALAPAPGCDQHDRDEGCNARDPEKRPRRRVGVDC
jgi:excisionase family DNA binding protein